MTVHGLRMQVASGRGLVVSGPSAALFVAHDGADPAAAPFVAQLVAAVTGDQDAGSLLVRRVGALAAAGMSRGEPAVPFALVAESGDGVAVMIVGPVSVRHTPVSGPTEELSGRDAAMWVDRIFHGTPSSVVVVEDGSAPAPGHPLADLVVGAVGGGGFELLSRVDGAAGTRDAASPGAPAPRDEAPLDAGHRPMPRPPAGFAAEPVGLAAEPVGLAPEPVGFAPEPAGFAPEPAGFGPEPESGDLVPGLGEPEPEPDGFTAPAPAESVPDAVDAAEPSDPFVQPEPPAPEPGVGSVPSPPWAAEPAVAEPAFAEPDPAGSDGTGFAAAGAAIPQPGWEFVPGPDLGAPGIGAPDLDPPDTGAPHHPDQPAWEQPLPVEEPPPVAASPAPLGGAELQRPDGSRLTVTSAVVVGREPQISPLVAAGAAVPLTLDDEARVTSRVHASIALDGGVLTVTDLGSANGTWILQAGDGDWTELVTQQPAVLHPGGRIRIGSDEFTFLGPAADPFAVGPA